MKELLTSSGLVEYAKSCMSLPHIYLWDANGQFLTDQVLDSLIEENKDWYTEHRVAIRRPLCNKNIRGFDCIGLIKSYTWRDYSQYNEEFYRTDSDFCTRTLIIQNLVKGSIESLPEIPGLVLWKKGHVGIYIGNNKVIECTIDKTKKPEPLGGIVQTDLSDKDWEVWLEYPGIIY